MNRKMRTLLLLILILSVLFTACDPFSYVKEPEYHALIYGIDYNNDSYNKLVNTIYDASDMGSAFSALGYTVKKTVNATRAVIFSDIADTDQGEDDILLFYFSGHGIGTDDSVALIPYLDTTVGGYELISPDELFSALHSIPGRKIVILDICYSGGFVPSSGFDTDALPENYTSAVPFAAFTESWRRYFSSSDLADEYPDIFVISATGAEEESWESNSIDNGYFTYYFLSALGYNHETETLQPKIPADSNGDGYLSLSEAYGAAFRLFRDEYLSLYAASSKEIQDTYGYYPHISGGAQEPLLAILP